MARIGILVEQLGMREAVAAQAKVPEAAVEELAELDGVIIGSPTRFGNWIAQLDNSSTRRAACGTGPSALNPMEGKDGLTDAEIAIFRAYGSLINGVADKLSA